MTSISREKIRAKAAPLNRSRTTAVATTVAAATPSPCSTRSPPSTAMLGAKTHSTDATMCAASPASSGTRRPTASESGPISNWPSARPTSVPVSVSCTAVSVVCRPAVMAGRAGRYMSMVSGPIAINAPSTRTSCAR